VWGCGSSDSQSESRRPPPADSAGAGRIGPSTDSLTLDLTRLNWPAPARVRVREDPVFHAAKQYDAVPLETVLRRLPGYAALAPEATQVVFECGDGYKPSMPLTKVLSRRAYVALRDADAPVGTDWLPLVKDGQVKEIAPFYVVYTDVPAEDETFKWPYNLVRISLVPLAGEARALYPAHDETRVKGYALFKTNCLTCHALNGIGGTMGPELNAPMSVTEYWRPEHLRAFIRNPAQYRAGVKMPRLAHLSDDDLTEIIRYLDYMAGHKKS
jgi:cytochrome c2